MKLACYVVKLGVLCREARQCYVVKLGSAVVKLGVLCREASMLCGEVRYAMA